MTIFDKVSRVARGAVIITEWLGSGGETVEPDHAQSRANKCLKCPMNNQSASVTGPVADAIKDQMSIKNALNMRVDGEKQLGFCDACLCQLRLKVWIEIKRIMPQKGDEFHPNCWVLSESKQ